MDYIESIFQFEQCLEHDELLLRTIGQDNQVLPPTPSQDGRDLISNPNLPGQKRKEPSSSNIIFDEIEENPKDNKKKIKKIVHRDIERHRRQEMATLYASLRSQLPIEYLKGKRSTSDHVNQTVNYIKHLQNNIQELHNKRNELQRSCNISCSSGTNAVVENSLSALMEDSVTILVRPCIAGVEVVVNTPLKQGLPLSRVLDSLIGDGLSIVTCISTKVDERLIYRIESEMRDGRSIDVCQLQQRLTKAYI